MPLEKAQRPSKTLLTPGTQVYAERVRAEVWQNSDGGQNVFVPNSLGVTNFPDEFYHTHHVIFVEFVFTFFIINHHLQASY
jgi:hypothetical protein